ncbi:MAG: N-acetylmuramoyl-L-alanine amidase [Bacteroidetes bacterium]|nr:N-acetylmuramoyl-L-alanine amidase [Bacteroidota bacterium]MBP6315826.1 N-acetylmuramoyl-L-alanine amidase [Chitinophagaceae bacterium]
MKNIVLILLCFLSTASVVLAGPKKDFVVLLHAAHGGTAKGVEAAGAVLEKNLTLAYAKELQKLGMANQFRVVMARENDQNVDMATLSKLAQQNNADIVISIHFNANLTDASHRGMECYVATQTASVENKMLGKFMGAELYTVKGMKFNGVNLKPMGNLLNQFSTPVALLELGYMTNEMDLAFVKTAEGKGEICQKILNAITRYKAQLEYNK